MIVSNTETDKESFEELLKQTKSYGEEILSRNLEEYSGLRFEEAVFSWMLACSVGSVFEGNIVHTDDRDFPDIVANGLWGVEVKLTKGDKWTSVGNSILETNRIESVHKIYILFGKTGGVPAIRYKSYDKCVSGIVVTHSPRYKIDMSLNENFFFDEIGIDYDKFRKKTDKIEIIKDFYGSRLKKGESLWWMDSMRGSDLIMKNYKDLGKFHKKQLLLELFTDCPEIFNSDYRGAAAILMNKGIICPNIRDLFSAGGRRQIGNFDVSAVVGRLYDMRNEFKTRLDDNLDNWLNKIHSKERKEIESVINL